MPSILFLVPNWLSPSEHFIQTQVEMLASGQCLEAVATKYYDGHVSGHEDITVYSLKEKRIIFRVLRRIGRIFGLDLFPSPSRKTLKDLLKSSKADIVLFQFGTFAVTLHSCFDLTKHQFFIHLHGADTYENLTPINYRQNLVSLADSSFFICNSLFTLNRMLKWGIPKDRLILKYPGVVVSTDPPQARENDGIFRILHLGRLVDCKSPDRTILAFNLACNMGLKGELIIAGDGPLKGKCEELRNKSKWEENIKILGAVTPAEGERLRSISNIFTLHSITGESTGQVEALGVSILEAMAAGLPIVSCQIGGILETVIDGRTGILIQPGDVEAQALAFLKLAQNRTLAYSMGIEGWKHVKENFSIAKEKEVFLAILGCNSPGREKFSKFGSEN